MDRLPDVPGFATPLYYASSIYDLMSSKAQVVQDCQNGPYRNLIKSTDPWAFLASTFGKEYVFPSSAWVYLPQVRHFPQEDASLSMLETTVNTFPWAPEIVKLTLKDQTGALDVYLPEGATGPVYRIAGFNIDRSAKELDWNANVIVNVSYHTTGSKVHLIHVDNSRVMSRERREVLELMGKLAPVNESAEFTHNATL